MDRKTIEWIIFGPLIEDHSRPHRTVGSRENGPGRPWFFRSIIRSAKPHHFKSLLFFPKIRLARKLRLQPPSDMQWVLNIDAVHHVGDMTRDGLH